MRFFFVLLCFGMFAGCTTSQVTPTAPATPAPTSSPTPTPRPKALAPSQVAPKDEDYALYLEAHLEALPKGDEERLLLDYVRFIHYGKSQFAKDYVKNLMAASEERDGPVSEINIFETAYTLCFFENERCAKSLGDLTRKYFVPKVKAGDLSALEILVIQKSAADADDLEEDAIADLLKDPDVVRFSSELRAIRKRYKDFLMKF